MRILGKPPLVSGKMELYNLSRPSNSGKKLSLLGMSGMAHKDQAAEGPEQAGCTTSRVIRNRVWLEQSAVDEECWALESS